MIDHTGVNVRDYPASRTFYQQALAPLGYDMVMEFGDEAAGFGVEGLPDFWIEAAEGPVNPHLHVAFRADTRHAVDEFHAAAVKAGGRDNGRPGLRNDYGPDYYAAYVLDPDGNNVEAVCHRHE
jgi:catechol 2,3-dioxygenase-like lactoylglutathione lyase family enzyme